MALQACCTHVQVCMSVSEPGVAVGGCGGWGVWMSKWDDDAEILADYHAKPSDSTEHMKHMICRGRLIVRELVTQQDSPFSGWSWTRCLKKSESEVRTLTAEEKKEKKIHLAKVFTAFHNIKTKRTESADKPAQEHMCTCGAQFNTHEHTNTQTHTLLD